MPVNVRNFVKDTTLTTQCFFGLLYYHWSYYNKYFLRCLQIKSSLVLITNYSMVNARNCVKDTTLTTLSVFFCLFYFHWSYYNKYFVRYLQIKSSLVLITNYSIVNVRNFVKDTKLTTLSVFFLSVLFSLVLLQVFCRIPANQIIISTYN